MKKNKKAAANKKAAPAKKTAPAKKQPTQTGDFLSDLAKGISPGHRKAAK